MKTNQNKDIVFPRNPPRSIVLMTFWGLIWPGFGQLFCGQRSKGILLFMLGPFCLTIFIIALINDFPKMLFLCPVICIASAIDANKLARRLAKGNSVGKWDFFPQQSLGESPETPPVLERFQVASGSRKKTARLS